MLPPNAPTFFLYGEPVRDAGDRFLHVEPLHVRSRPANWTIQPHAHHALDQLFCIGHGGGTMTADGRTIRIEGPTLLLVPSRTVHGFQFDAGTTGQVLTLAEPYWQDLANRQPDLATLFDRPAAATATRRESRHLNLVLRQVMTENAWAAPGHHAALDALTLLALVLALRAVSRQAAQGSAIPAADAAQAHLVAQFRHLVEQHFRQRPKLAFYSEALRVSDSKLRRACLAIARQSPLLLVQERSVLEAKRMLLYSNKTASEIAYTIGFEDPAYFSRFFQTMTGTSPRTFRNGTLSTPSPSRKGPG
jgi:AraC family transcriptional activator of pobA